MSKELLRPRPNDDNMADWEVETNLPVKLLYFSNLVHAQQQSAPA